MSAPAERLKMSEAWKQWEGEIVEGRFPLRRFLGSSDHSAVFLTEVGQPPQKAALKFVEASSANIQAQLARWERAAKLSHPHLVRVLHFGSCRLGRASMLYVVSELAEENLSQILPARPLNSSEAEFMLRSVLEALAYLHGQGLVNGRLKPSNIMAVEEQLKIASDSVCRPGEKNFAGHPTIYDPPELTTAGLSGEGDVWSLGVTLVEALTQKPSLGDAIRQTDPSVPETLPVSFQEIARQCLRLDPQRRWTVSDIAAHLVPLAPAPQKNTASRYGLVIGGVAVLAGAVWVGQKFLDQKSASTPPPEARTVEPTTSSPAPAAPPSTSPAVAPPTSAEPAKPLDTRPSPSSPAVAAPTTSTQPAPAPRAAAPTQTPPSSASAPGSVVERFVPPVSQRSRSTINGKVRVTVKVDVDPSGKVTKAHLESPGPSHFFAKIALDAGPHWKFKAPQRNGEPVASQWYLRYAFGRSGTDVQPLQVSPRD
jgi:TonB family protein